MIGSCVCDVLPADVSASGRKRLSSTGATLARYVFAHPVPKYASVHGVIQLILPAGREIRIFPPYEASEKESIDEQSASD
jgi:hypothetical protein